MLLYLYILQGVSFRTLVTKFIVLFLRHNQTYLTWQQGCGNALVNPRSPFRFFALNSSYLYDCVFDLTEIWYAISHSTCVHKENSTLWPKCIFSKLRRQRRRNIKAFWTHVARFISFLDLRNNTQNFKTRFLKHPLYVFVSTFNSEEATLGLQVRYHEI